jgi:hypothetical protein
MRQYTILLFAIGSLAISVGCGSESVTGKAAVAQVMHQFLDGVRTADSETTSKLLTPLALEKTIAEDMEVLPPGSPTARFEIGAVEIVEGEKALVETVWHDVDADGKPTSDSTTWALKLIDGEWKIRGFAADMGPNQDPLVMDFEDPAEMKRIQNRVSAQGQPPTTPLQATQPPQDPFRAVPR